MSHKNYIATLVSKSFVEFGVLNKAKLIEKNKYEFLIVDDSSDFIRAVDLTSEKWPDHIHLTGLGKEVKYAPLEKYLTTLLDPWSEHLQYGFIDTIARGNENINEYYELNKSCEDYDEFRKNLKYIGETYFIPFYEEMSSLQNIYRQIANCSAHELRRTVFCTGNTISRYCKAIAMADICGDKIQAEAWLRDYVELIENVLQAGEVSDEEKNDGAAYLGIFKALEASLKNEEYKKYGVKAD